ncbi:PLD nuclease N-terminal domain-containing protein [Pokkaliibacter sp. CJK22405]|uniref:PLD nuclease N-terminal domain-containing protein n=1 Tax=Pokkaliibacter sp. CJK22405 TaxID=3384615 RepID=UPI00398558BE
MMWFVAASAVPDIKEDDMEFGYGGLFGLIVLALDIMAIASILKSSYSGVGKFCWILAVLILPILGMLLYFIFGRKGTV